MTAMIGGASPLGKGRSRAKKLAWKAKYLKNRAARAAFNSEWKGECRNKNAVLFHSGLTALSMGLGS